MKSRASWLNNTREYLKQDRPKKKFFKVHKNVHTIDFSPKSLTPLNNHKFQIPPDSLTPELSPVKSTKTNEISSTLKLIIKEKDSEISNLRKLYDEANCRLKNVENQRYVKMNLENLSISSPKKSMLPDLSALNNSGMSSKVIRNKSTQNYRVDTFNDFNFLNQARFTKNRPKIVFGNPITGIPLLNHK